MKALLLFMTLALAVSSQASRLDLRKLQSPVLSAKDSAQSPYPRFCGYLDDRAGAPRIAGLDSKQQRIIKKRFKLKVLNEYRLYDKSPMTKKERVTLERYCTRYNRQLWISLNLQYDD